MSIQSIKMENFHRVMKRLADIGVFVDESFESVKALRALLDCHLIPIGHIVDGTHYDNVMKILAKLVCCLGTSDPAWDRLEMPDDHPFMDQNHKIVLNYRRMVLDHAKRLQKDIESVMQEIKCKFDASCKP
jgi:hypothetical protein